MQVSRLVPVPPAAIWEALIDISQWPRWGPSVRGATLDDGSARLRAGSKGRVRTALGLWLPFEVTGWEEGRRWSWKVAGIPATGHRSDPGPEPGTGLVTIEVPTWAVAYAPLCRVALRRIEVVAAETAAGW